MMYRLISYIPSNDIYVCKTLEQALCDTLMPPTPVYSQVLALCVHYQYDARTLLQTGLVSKAQQATCSAHVCQQLPRLLTTAHREVILRSQANKYEATELAAYLRPLQWLYQSAGPAAVDSPAVAEALLGLSPENPSELQAQRAQIAAMYGVRVTSELIVSASRRRLCNPEMWVRAHLPDGWEEYQVHVPPGTPLPAYVYEMMLGSCQGAVHELLPQITPQQMLGLLYVAVNAAWEVWPAYLLLQHDKEHTHVMSLSADISNSHTSNSGSNSQVY